jgi:hypothetical protein
MASVDLWPSDKLLVSKPTWWLEVHARVVAVESRSPRSRALGTEHLERACFHAPFPRAASTSILLVGMEALRTLGCAQILTAFLYVTFDERQVLRVVNDDLVKPQSGFGTHPHRDMVCEAVILHFHELFVT